MAANPKKLKEHMYVNQDVIFLGLIHKFPGRKIVEYARMVGWTDRNVRHKYPDLIKLIKSMQDRNLPTGYKDKDGNIEAWDDDDDCSQDSGADADD